MPEYPLLQLAELMRGLDTELAGEEHLYPPVGAQRVGLTIGAIQRFDQERPGRLA